MVASMAFGGTPVKVPVVAPGLRTPLSLSATQEKALEEENVEVLSPKELKQLKEWNEKVQKEEEEAEELEQQVVEKFLSDPERVRKVKEWAESMVKDNEEIRASTAAREEMMKGKDLFENDELIKMCRAYMRDPSTPVPEGLRPGPNGPATIGKIFEKAKAAKKLGDLRPDRLFRKLCGHLREISGNAQHWLCETPRPTRGSCTQWIKIPRERDSTGSAVDVPP